MLIYLSVITGCVAGLLAFVFKSLVAWTSSLLTTHFRIEGMNPWLILIPVAGILLTGFFCRVVLKTNISSGTDQIADGLSRGNYYLRFQRIFTPLIASAMTLGFGGSAGSEGPIASSGAAVGSNLGSVFGVDSGVMKLLVAIGAAAGIAAIFKAPIGGFFFAVECLGITLVSVGAVALALACLCGGMTAYFLSGGHTDINFQGFIEFEPHLLPVVMLLGVFCGLYGLYYSRVMRLMKTKLQGIRSSWVRNLVSGLVIGVLLFFFPVLYGEGYGPLGEIVNGNFSAVIDGSPVATLADVHKLTPLIFVTLGIILAKCFACGATVYGGGVAGEFAPTLFAGGLGGLFFALVANTLPGVSLPVAHFALFGMAGAMSAIIGAPLMAIFIATEMTGSYASLLPISICGAMAYATVALVRHLRGRRLRQFGKNKNVA